MEVFIDAISVMLIGMVIVFAVLILLLFIVKSIKYVGGNKAENITENKAENITMPLPIVPTTPDINSDTTNNVANDCELAAVITAAIAASLGVSPDKLIVRSLRQVSQNDKSAWRTAAKNDSQHKINPWR